MQKLDIHGEFKKKKFPKSTLETKINLQPMKKRLGIQNEFETFPRNSKRIQFDFPSFTWVCCFICLNCYIFALAKDNM